MSSHSPHPRRPLPFPTRFLQHTHGLAQLVRAQGPQSLSAEVAGASHRHGHFCWVGTKGSLVRLLQTFPSSFPTSTFGSSPCPLLPVKSRILPPSSLDQEDIRALKLGTPKVHCSGSDHCFLFRHLNSNLIAHLNAPMSVKNWHLPGSQ